MGLTQAKPENPYVRDRVRLCDGLAPLVGATVAAAGAGRYVLILGEKKIVPQADGTERTTFQLDYIDLLRSTRVRLVIGAFCNFGALVGFYALDERTVVLVDAKDTESTLRQRLVALEPERSTTHAFLDRGYRLQQRALFFIGRSAVSEDRVITIAPALTGREAPVALVLPKNPLDCQTPAVNITPALTAAAQRLRGEIGPTDDATARFHISSWDAPFFLSSTKVGFFTDRPGVLTVDPSHIVAYDLLTGAISIERSRADPATNFPYSAEGQHPFDARSFTASSRQLGLIITHRHSAGGWRVAAGRLTHALGSWMFWMFLACADKQWDMLSQRFLSMSIFFGLLKFRLLQSRKVRFGLLDTSTMQWREQPGVADQSMFTSMKMAVFPDGHSLIYDRANDAAFRSRDLGSCSSSSEPREELRVLSNPGRCFSLKTLAEMQLRRRPIACLSIEQIAARIQ